MTDDQKEMLEKVVEDVLERFAFMFTDMPDESIEEWQGDYLHSTITFQGDSQGIIALTVPDELSKDLAANILGLLDPDEVTDETAEDAVKELLNVVCGDLVARLFGTKAVFDLTVPSVARIDRNKRRELVADGDSVKMLVEDKEMLVSLVVDA